MSAQQPSIVPFTPQAYEELSQQFDPYPVSDLHTVSTWCEVGWQGLGGLLLLTEGCSIQLAMQFISQYSPEDIVTAQIEGSSGALWRISPPSRAQMKQELYNGTADITLRFIWNFQRWVLCCWGSGGCPTLPNTACPQGPGQGRHCGVYQ